MSIFKVKVFSKCWVLLPTVTATVSIVHGTTHIFQLQVFKYNVDVLYETDSASCGPKTLKHVVADTTGSSLEFITKAFRGQSPR